jgi:hypothetical protein
MKLHSIFSRAIYLFVIFITSFQMLHAQEIGLELYSLREQFKTDVPGTLAKIKSWNIKEIEGGGTYGLPTDEYKKLLEQNNLKMVSVGADFDQLAKSPQTAIDEAKTLVQNISYVFGFRITAMNLQLMISIKR